MVKFQGSSFSFNGSYKVKTRKSVTRLLHKISRKKDSDNGKFGNVIFIVAIQSINMVNFHSFFWSLYYFQTSRCVIPYSRDILNRNLLNCAQILIQSQIPFRQFAFPHTKERKYISMLSNSPLQIAILTVESQAFLKNSTDFAFDLIQKTGKIQTKISWVYSCKKSNFLVNFASLGRSYVPSTQ